MTGKVYPGFPSATSSNRWFKFTFRKQLFFAAGFNQGEDWRRSMLKKTALPLFGLVAMLIFVNPPQAHAGVVIAVGPAYPRPVYVRPYRYVAPVPFVAYQPAPLFYGPTYVRPGWGYRPGFHARPYIAPRPVHREFVVRRPYWRR